MQGFQVVFTGRGQVESRPVEIGTPAEDQILVETLHSAISPGTERAFLMAETNTITRTRGFPFEPGYSNVGRVIAVGAAVRHYRVGQHIVTTQAHVSHYLMPEMVGPGYPPEKYRGTFRAPFAPGAPFVPVHYIWPLPAGLDARMLKASACFGIVGVGATGARYARLELGESVLVLGLGPVGLYAGLTARLSGGVPVLGLDPVAARRETALAMGFDAVFATPEELPGTHPLMTDAAPRVVIEATGRPDLIPVAFRLCARNGRVILLGSTRGVTEEVDFYNDVHRKGLTVVGAHVLTRPVHDSKEGRWTAWDEDALTLRLIAAGRLDCSPLIAHEFAAKDAASAYRLLGDAPETLGAVLNWA